VAHLKSPLVRKLEKVLTQRFPSPATVRLEDHDGIIGVITSAGFAGMESIDRQNLIGDILATHLSPDDRRRVQVIVAVTPEEGTGYLAGEKA
jgi:stress-induced morphogen